MVFSRSCSAPIALVLLRRPSASTSSMNSTQGWSLRASAKSLFTSCVPCPAYRDAWKSLPEAERKGRPTSPASALAQCVLPTPGGPSRSTPRGGTAPSLLYFSLSTSASTRSRSSSTASSWPRTSAKETSTHSVTWKEPSGLALALRLLASSRLASTSSAAMAPRSARTAPMAAPLSRPSRSAGEKAGVIFASARRSGPSPSNLSGPAAPARISSRLARSGSLNSMRRSKRPVRSRASSRTSGRFVAARKSTPDEGRKPSIFASKALRFAS
mmetsp:Transcript_48488/g.144847  ORF Transcript_48488/g.144847 Transcript_48488/m.144847 type:complete len:271 (-) Transcript_48488:1009-1821(-)